MDFRRFSLGVKDVLKEANLLRNKNGTACNYDLVILFAKIWFLKAEIFVHPSSTPLTTSVEDFIKGLHEGSRFLQKSFSPRLEKKPEHEILKLVEQVPEQVESLYQSSQSEGLVGNRLRGLLYKFLEQVMLFKAEMLLSELLKNETILILPLKNQIGTLREGLIFLIKSDINQPKVDTEDEELILADIEGVAAGVISLCNSCPADRVTGEDVKNIEYQLSDLLMKVQLLKTKLKQLYFQIPRLSFPKTLGLGFIISLLQRLKELPSREHDSVACATHQIEVIRGDLEFMIHARYGHVFEKDTGNIRTWLVNTAYQVEYVIDSMVVGSGPVSQQLLWLYHLSEEITHAKKQLIDYCENNRDVVFHTDSYGCQPLISQLNTPTIEERVIIDLLTRGTNQLEVVAITGMPGIGKTALARNVFCSPTIVDHFHVHVWCRVSQTYRRRELLLDILGQFFNAWNMMLAMSDEELHDRLCNHMYGKRYLIVMDKVQSIAAWNLLLSSIPDNSCGSRILMTSRLFSVVPNPHLVRRLDHKGSWELLKMKNFGDKLWPQGLWDVGKQTNERFIWQPVVTAAGLLVWAQEYKWQEIAESVSSQLLTESMNVFERSYHHLPDNLKDCFLYFGVYPRNKDVSVRKLLWLWIAEGFIPKVEFKSLEDVAEEYLMDLIERSLVMVSKRRSNGKVKTCRVPDEILDFCLLKAKEAKFLCVLSGEPSYISSHDGVHYEHPIPPNPSDFRNAEQYRLSICGDFEKFIALRPSGPIVRSLLLFATDEMYPGCDNDLSFISINFKFLKVLDLESVNVGNTLENGIDLPVHLRYLGVGGDMDSIPSSFPRLENLETLVVKGLTNKFVLPADTIWSMTKLRHVHVTNHCIFTLQNDKNGSDSKLYSLVSLSMPCFSFGDQETNHIIMRLPNLRHLKCILLQPRGGGGTGSTNACQFPDLGSLTVLESLKIMYYGRPLNIVEFNLPSTLKKLTLSNFRLPWSHISVVGRLPNLEVLKLTCRAFEGSSWEMRAGEFGKLRYLKLDSLDIIRWYAHDNQLLYLQQLVLRNCMQLQKLPSGIGPYSLQRIEVHKCGISAEAWVRTIAEEQLIRGNRDFVVDFS